MRACGRNLVASVEVIANDNNLCGECPIWDWEKEQLYWTDSVGLKFYCYDWRTRHRSLVVEGFQINGYALDQSGGFVASNNSGIWLWDGADQRQLIADHVDNHKCSINDCIADPAGRLIAGSCFYDSSAKYELGKLICVDTDGRARILDEGFHLSNGIGFSPDHKILYFTDSVARRIFAYDYDAEEGLPRNRRVFVNVPRTEGLPDGLTVDAEGFVWSAQWYGKQIVRYDPDGVVERRVETPAKQTSSLTFGGPNLTDIFITSAARSEAMPVMPSGYDPGHGFFGGPLFRIRLGIQGRREFKTKFNLPLDNPGHPGQATGQSKL